MDFTKFASMLSTESLFFCRSDKFDDPFEGSLPKINVLSREISIRQWENCDEKLKKQAIDGFSIFYKLWRRYVAINCWHMNEAESMAMWKLYLKSNEGIAVQSRFSLLEKSFPENNGEKIYFGTVNYIDYDSEYIDSNEIFSQFVHKKSSFSHEREIRAIIHKIPEKTKEITENNETRIQNYVDHNEETINSGVNVKVNLETLVERVYLAPGSPNWLYELICSVSERYGYKFNIVKSSADTDPFF